MKNTLVYCFCIFIIISCTKNKDLTSYESNKVYLENSTDVNLNNATQRDQSPGERHNEICEFLLTYLDSINSESELPDKLEIMEDLYNDEYETSYSFDHLLDGHGELIEHPFESSTTLTATEKSYFGEIKDSMQNHDWELWTSLSGWVDYLEFKISDLPNESLPDEEFAEAILDVWLNSSELWYSEALDGSSPPLTSAISIQCLIEGGISDAEAASTCDDFDLPCIAEVAVTSFIAYEVCEEDS